MIARIINVVFWRILGYFATDIKTISIIILRKINIFILTTIKIHDVVSGFRRTQ